MNMPRLDSELMFLSQYFQVHLDVYDKFDFSNCAKNKSLLFQLTSEASSLHKVLIDFNEENYNWFTESLDNRLNVFLRLNRFIDKALEKLGGKSERELFGLYKEPVSLDFFIKNDFNEAITVDLKDYLVQLKKLSGQPPPEISHYFDNKHHMELWLKKTDAVMDEISQYLIWIIQFLSKHKNYTPVFLLRDTLLLYLGTLWAMDYGVPLNNPEPLLVSRKFLNFFADNDDMYDGLTYNLYDTLLAFKDTCNLQQIQDDFIKNADSIININGDIVNSAKEYFEQLNLKNYPLGYLQKIFYQDIPGLTLTRA